MFPERRSDRKRRPALPPTGGVEHYRATAGDVISALSSTQNKFCCLVVTNSPRELINSPFQPFPVLELIPGEATEFNGFCRFELGLFSRLINCDVCLDDYSCNYSLGVVSYNFGLQQPSPPSQVCVCARRRACVLHAAVSICSSMCVV